MEDKKIWEVYHFIYGDVCDNSYFGKTGTHITMGFIEDTESNVKVLVDKLNKKNNSYYAHKPVDKCDNNYENTDYISYKEIEISTVESFEKTYYV